MAVVVTRCRPSGLTQTADIKGGWLVFRTEDGGKTTTVFIPFDPPIIYSQSRASVRLLEKLRVKIQTVLRRNECSWNKMRRCCSYLFMETKQASVAQSTPLVSIRTAANITVLRRVLLSRFPHGEDPLDPRYWHVQHAPVGQTVLGL